MDQRAFSPADLELLSGHALVRRLDYYDEMPSTSDRAIARAGDGALQTPLLVLAERQTAGRGRGGNRWWSRAGALTFSMVLDLPAVGLSPASSSRLSLVTAMGVSDALSDLLPQSRLQLKWPNDVFLADRKVAGILLETAAGCFERAVVGIGVNVNNSLAGAPAELQSTATSMFDAGEKEFALIDVLLKLLDSLSRSYGQLSSGELYLPTHWRERCLLQGRNVEIVQGQQTVVGLCHGIDESGALLLVNNSGMHRLHSGTVARFD